jgi:translation initiation factor 4B
VGNLAFDLTENELELFFSGIKVSECSCSFLFCETIHESMQVKSVKIIKSKDEKPKGFGYIEFEDVDGLKDALLKTGSVRSPFLIWVCY